LRRVAVRGSIVVLLALAACETTRTARRYKKDTSADALSRFEQVALTVGEFELDGASAVVDGDTIHVKGLDSSLRLLAIDTEETFKHDDERRAFEGGWEQYKKGVRGSSARPVKFATPLGEDAKTYAAEFFEDVTTVRIERDHPGEIRDYYGRYLAYVFAQKNGKWVNYNVEAVRNGLTPYFVKYGRSRRFHRDFLEAQQQARAAKRGIWDPKKQHYDDYDERLAWWNQREQAIYRFEKQMEESPSLYVVLTRWDALFRLEQHVGETVTVLGAVSDIKLGDKGPSLVKLSKNRGNDFDVVFWDKDVLLSSGVMQNKGEFVQIRGTIAKYQDPFRKTERLQLIVSLPGQVLAPSRELDKLLSEEDRPQQARVGATREEAE
jgi:endonuclease YncB( thermonuclease family)